MLCLEFVGDVLDQNFVKVVTTQMGITVRAQHFNQFVVDFQDGNVKRTTTEVEHGDLFVFLVLQTVSQSGCGRLIDDSLNLQSGNLTGVFRRLPLGIVKVSRNRDYRATYCMSEIGFRRFLQLRRTCAETSGGVYVLP